MSGIATAVVAGAVISSAMSSSAQSDAAETAANAQTNASNASISEQNRQFNAIKELLAPYVTAGQGSLTAQQNLLGLNGNPAQQTAINSIEQSPQFQSLSAQGENAILQNASATGGLRGGNTEAALAQFRPQLLRQLLNDQYAKLGGITSIGQNAAAGTGNAGMQSANQISSQLNQIGAAQAGQALAQGRADATMWNTVGSLPATLYGMGVFKGF